MDGITHISRMMENLEAEWDKASGTVPMVAKTDTTLPLPMRPTQKPAPTTPALLLHMPPCKTEEMYLDKLTTEEDGNSMNRDYTNTKLKDSRHALRPMTGIATVIDLTHEQPTMEFYNNPGTTSTPAVRKWLETGNAGLGRTVGIRWLRKKTLLLEEGKKTSSAVLYLEKQTELDRVRLGGKWLRMSPCEQDTVGDGNTMDKDNKYEDRNTVNMYKNRATLDTQRPTMAEATPPPQPTRAPKGRGGPWTRGTNY
ncbi:hypothetical protein BDZ91DRAFT_800905 [Kalaharituber pfeilii]|nr:hypothetical protein BDZ91DRAFT_800905 [Kalaharituber pfeilii]